MGDKRLSTFEKYTKNETLSFKNISDEKYRQYEFVKNGLPYIVVLDKPVALNVSASGGHRVITESGGSYYIPSGWVSLRWINKSSVFFNF